MRTIDEENEIAITAIDEAYVTERPQVILSLISALLSALPDQRLRMPSSDGLVNIIHNGKAYIGYDARHALILARLAKE